MKKLRRIRFRMAIALAALWMGMGVLPSANAQRPFVVQGELTGLPDGTVLLLSERRNNMDSRVDCDTLQNGRFRLEAMASEVKMFTVRLFDERLLTNMLQVWGQSGDTVSVNGEGRHGFEWQVQSANPLQAEYALIFMQQARNIARWMSVSSNARNSKKGYSESRKAKDKC